MRTKISLLLIFIFTLVLSSYTGDLSDLKINSHNGKARISEDNECPLCHGSGITSCSLCNGKGIIECSDCKGEGDIKVACSFCIGKKNIDGKICPGCTGDGYITENCASCSGKGAFRCSRCNYRGVISCINCQGIGEILNQ